MDEDANVKERARLARNSGHVVLSGHDAAARLDGRISEQRGDCNGEADKEAKHRARRTSDSTPGAYQTPPSGLKELSRMEADAAANARPGAYLVAESSTLGELSQIESDIVAKSRARPPSAICNVISQLEAEATGRPHHSASSNAGSPRTDLNQMEADVAAKSRARNSSQPTSSVAYREPTARTQLSQLESDVAAKSRACQDRTGSTTPGTKPLRSTEDAVVQKGQSASQGTTRHELNQLEADVVTKQGQRPSVSTSRPGISIVRDLDERIAYKTGISLDDDQKEANPPEHGPTRVENVSKLTEIQTETVSATLEKYQARQQGAVVRQYQSPTSGDRGLPYPDVETPGAEGEKVVVAIAVEEDDEDAFIPAAVEYDPDAKPSIYKNRRFRLYGVLACSLLFVLLAGVVGILSQKEETIVTVDTTTVPTNPRWNLGIREQLELVVGSEKLSDEESAPFRALEWIIQEDPMQLLPEDSNLAQRFLLAMFYFETHEEGEWLSCNRQEETDPDDVCYYQKLVSVFPHEYRGITWFRWLSDKHECLWAGLFCDDFDQLRHIELKGQKMKGTLPHELAYFPFLQGVSLAWNQFYGTIPTEYGEINHLLNFEVHHNSLTGTLPSWPKAKNIELLNIGGNDLTGTLPSEIKYLSHLKGLYLFENFLTGTFPEELAQLTLLNYIRLQSNSMSGSLMPELGNLSPNELWLQTMPLTGTIPSELGTMRLIDDLRLSNTELEGTIPDEIYNITTLWRLDLFGANFVGTISSKIEQLTSLGQFRISDNSFTGTLPAASLGQLSGLDIVWLERNQFSGEVPSALCENRGIPGGLYELYADCLPSVYSGTPPAITCDCCDLCCDNETDYCAAA